MAPHQKYLMQILRRSTADNYNGSLHSTLGEVDCDGEGSTLYVKVVATVIFVVVWPFIVFDMKWFPMGRPAAALVGAALMVIFNAVGQMEVYDIQAELGDMQTIFLLVGMMMLSYYYDREGLLRLVALKIFGGGQQPLRNILWRICLLSAFMSALITNDATCLVVTPLILFEFEKQGRNRRELLPICLGIATSSNIGSAATVFGNPQNAFIASAAGVNLLQFFIAELPAACIGLVISVILLYIMFYKVTLLKPPPLDEDDREALARDGRYPKTLADERESLALSYDQSHDPYLSSAIAKERELLYSQGSQTSGSLPQRGKRRGPSGGGRGASPYPGGKLKVPNSHGVPDIRVDDERNGKKTEDYQTIPDVTSEDEGEDQDNLMPTPLKDRTLKEKLFAAWLGVVTALVVVLLAIPPPPVLPVAFNLGLVPMGAAILTMLMDTILNKKYAYDAMLKIDWTVILMFMGLFVWLGGFQNTCFPEIAFNKMSDFMNIEEFGGTLLFSVFVIVGSNVFSNVPLVILIAYRIDGLCGNHQCDGPLGGLLLAWVSTVAGNFTLIGSVANLIVAEKARSSIEFRLTFWNYIIFGMTSTTIVLFGMLPIVYFLGRVQ